MPGQSSTQIERAGLWLSLADGHIAMYVMLMFPSPSLSDTQDTRRLSLQWDMLARFTVSGEAVTDLAGLGTVGAPHWMAHCKGVV